MRRDKREASQEKTLIEETEVRQKMTPTSRLHISSDLLQLGKNRFQ